MLAPDTMIQERYRVVYALEERPDAAIYRVRDEQTGKLALLAALPFSGADQQRELESTARQISGIRHDLLLPLERTFTVDETFYVVSADSGGQDLERTLRSGGAQPEAATLTSATKLLDLVDTLHTQQPPLLLGDFGPGEIWVTDDGVWKLAPYALLTPLGRTNSPYRAPELLDANADPTTVSDTYTLSALLYHVLTGWAPPTAEQLQAGAPLNPPRAMNPNLSVLAEQALLRGLQAKSLNRYQNARELRLALDTVRMMAGRSLGIGPENFQTAPPPQYQPQPAYPQPAPPLPVPQQPAPQYPPPPAPYPQPAYPPQPQTYVTPPYAPPAKQSGVSTGCLVAIAVGLLLLVVLIGGALALLFGTSAGRNLLGAVNQAATAPATSAPAATAAPAAAAPTIAPAVPAPNLSARAITLQRATTITVTSEITNTIVGPVAFAPDGKLLAVGIDRQVLLYGDGALDRLPAVAGAHPGQITTIAFAPDGQTIASGAVDDPVIRLWDTAGARPPRTLTGHTGWIRSVAWSPDGKTLASGSVDQTVKLWDVASGKELRTLSGHTGMVGIVAWSPDGQRLASTSRDGTVRLWDASTGTEASGFKFSMPIGENGTRPWTTGLAFSADGKTLAVGAVDAAVRLIDAATGQEIRKLTGHTGWVVLRGLAFSADGATLWSGSLDGTVRRWDVATGKETGSIQASELGVYGIALRPDGGQIAVTSNDEGKVSVWDAATSQTVSSASVGQGWVLSLAFSTDGKNLMAGGANGTVRVAPQPEGRVETIFGSVAALQPAAGLPNDRVAVINNQGRLVVLTPGQAQLPLEGLGSAAVAVTASPDGSVIAAAAANGTVVLWDANSGQVRATLRNKLALGRTLMFSSDGKTLAAAGSATRGDQPDQPLIEVWDVTTGKVTASISGLASRVVGLAFQPRSSILAVLLGDGTIELWQSASGTRLRQLAPDANDERYAGLAFGPDGGTLITAARGGALLFWDIAGGQPTRVAVTEGTPLTLALSPDGERLAVSVRSDRNPIQIFTLPGR